MSKIQSKIPVPVRQKIPKNYKSQATQTSPNIGSSKRNILNRTYSIEKIESPEFSSTPAKKIRKITNRTEPVQSTEKPKFYSDKSNKFGKSASSINNQTSKSIIINSKLVDDISSSENHESKLVKFEVTLNDSPINKRNHKKASKSDSEKTPKRSKKKQTSSLPSNLTKSKILITQNNDSEAIQSPPEIIITEPSNSNEMEYHHINLNQYIEAENDSVTEPIQRDQDGGIVDYDHGYVRNIVYHSEAESETIESQHDEPPISSQEPTRLVPRHNLIRINKEREEKKNELDRIDHELYENLHPNPRLRRSERLRIKRLSKLQEERIRVLEELFELEREQDLSQRRINMNTKNINLRPHNQGYNKLKKNIRKSRLNNLSSLREE